MPNFLKKFGERRRSQGNSMDTGSSPVAAEPSFRVLPRNDDNRKSVSGLLDGPYQPARQSSYEEESISSNRGSNSTTASGHSRIFDPTPTGYSSTSTIQSPVEAARKNYSSSPNYLTLPDDNEDGEDFSNMFADMKVNNNRRSKMLDEKSTHRPPPQAAMRGESEPMLGSFMNRKTPSPSPLFTKVQSRYSWGNRTSTDGLMSSPGLRDSPTPEESPPPVPVHAPNGLKDLTSDEQYGALSPPTRPTLRNQNSFSKGDPDGSDADARMVRESFVAKTKQSNLMSSPLGRNKGSNVLAPQIKSISAMSSDTSLNTASTLSSTSSTNTPVQIVTASRHTRDVTPVGHPDAGQGSSSTSTTPRATRAKPTHDAEEPLFDSTLANAIFAPENQKILASPKRPEVKKRMTNAEFAKLKLEENLRSKSGNAADSDSSDDYEDDEEDPATIARKRKEQQEKDAKHAIWRQTMKKDIGDHSVPFPPSRTQSTPNFSFEASSVAGASLSSNEDDDDVPIGLLMAHGFPNKNKQPDPRLSSNSFVGVRPMSNGNAGSSRPPSSIKLPPFARALPEDPYMSSANLANPINRQSLGMNQRGTSYAGSVMDVNPIGSVPPGGLVGVIMEEERLKSMRRGSPNVNGTYGQQSLAPQQDPRMSRRSQMNPQQIEMQRMTYGMGVPLGSMNNPYNIGTGMMQQPMIGSTLPSDNPAFQQQLIAIAQQQEASNRLIQQMSQQMAMQMGMNPGLPAGYAPYMPQQTMMHPMPMTGLPPPQQPQRNMRNSQANLLDPRQGRTMSMMSIDPSGGRLNSFAQQQNYTPSIAPSERSNVGAPGRYRPVNNMRMTDSGSTITAGSTSGNFLSATIHSGKKAAASPIADEEGEWQKHANARFNRKK